MHAYRYATHERRVAALARELGFPQVSASHEVSPLIKLVGRGDTTVVDAYLSPILRRYVAQVAATSTPAKSGSAPGRGAPRLMFMMSSGGLTAADLFRGKDAILSGPAGGVVGMAQTGRAAGFARLIGFDMGGTSTDVSHFAGEYERAFETEVAGVRMRAPMMLHPHGGGGRRLDPAFRRRAVSRRAGLGRRQSRAEMLSPRRPARGHRRQCHGRQAHARFLPEDFRAAAGRSRSTPKRCARRFAALAHKIGDGRSAEEVADGFIRIAVENMANAIKKISVQRGYDVTRYALNCFGGAGGQHACLVADALGMKSVLIHPLSSLLSAYGMGLADIRSDAPAGDRGAVRRRRRARALAARGRAGSRETRSREVAGQGVAGRQDQAARARAYPLRRHRYGADRGAGRLRRGAAVRSCRCKMKSAFERAHKARFGFVDRSQVAGDRGGLGRGGRRRRDVSREGAQS